MKSVHSSKIREAKMPEDPQDASLRRLSRAVDRRTLLTGAAAAGAAASSLRISSSSASTPQAVAAQSTDDGGTETGDAKGQIDPTDKVGTLDAVRENGSGQNLTTNQGLKVSTTDDSLKAGDRGPTLMEDFHFREKITHFDHERMPERVVHARGSGAHGEFQVYESMSDLTRAAFLQDPSVSTPVFVRFSTVAGSRGSADTVRDVRGFATKFYTSEGVFDLVGNNIPVFFIQDAIKFPDLIHAVKPEPPDEIPQAQTAHDTAWDFFSLVPETTHMVMWIMSDRAIPRSFRMMEGFGVHTFRMVNAQGTSRFVKFHWKPVLGMASLAWDEAQKLSGKDPDWLRRDLWDSIENKAYPEWELGLQIIEEDDEDAFNFDILDATKIWPEELIPVKRVGKLTLNKNPDNFFAETEQVAFHPGHIVPGIDFSDDPLLQGRLFSYFDTQINRFNSANFAQVPINRPTCPVHNNQLDGFMRQSIHVGRASYHPNSLGDNAPAPSSGDDGGYVSYPAKVSGQKVRARNDSFKNYFSQARLFYVSLSKPEQEHLTNALRFELGKVKSEAVRQRMVENLAKVDSELAKNVADWIGVDTPSGANVATATSSFHDQKVETSPALSIENNGSDSIKSRRVAILVADGVNESDVDTVKSALKKGGAVPEVIAKTLGSVTGANGGKVAVDHSALTVDSVLYDAVYVPGGSASAKTLSGMAKVRYFVAEAFAHYKPIAANADGITVLKSANITAPKLAENGTDVVNDLGVVTTAAAADSSGFTSAFAADIAKHRFWNRPDQDQVPAV
jgi:catalase